MKKLALFALAALAFFACERSDNVQNRQTLNGNGNGANGNGNNLPRESVLPENNNGQNGQNGNGQNGNGDNRVNRPVFSTDRATGQSDLINGRR